MSLPERLDDLARLTGIPQLNDRLAAGTQRRRHLRWTPIIALAIATIGVIAVARESNIGMLVLGVGEVTTFCFPLFGPIKPSGTLAGVDERDRQLRRDGYFPSLAFVRAGPLLRLFALPAVAFGTVWDRVRPLFFLPALRTLLL